MAETTEVDESSDVTLCMIKDKDWLKSWIKAATRGSREGGAVAAEKQPDVKSTMSTIQREFLHPVTPVAVPLHSADTSTSSMDNTVDELIAFITTTLRGRLLPNTTLCKLSRACTPVVSHPKALPIVEALLTAPMQPTLSMLQTFALEECFLKAVTQTITSQSSPLCLSYEAKARLWAVYFPAFQDQVSAILDQVKVGGVSAIPGLETQLKSSEVLRACHDHLHLKYYLEYALTCFSAYEDPRVETS